eukprot:GFYU01004587.1.p1 GENE.GFYU01004587.1~~GFYU01004587.1.p1  ORF type:complete len:726 (-),score=167.55 GFYU01004587.1:157-2334(-)
MALRRQGSNSSISPQTQPRVESSEEQKRMSTSSTKEEDGFLLVDEKKGTKKRAPPPGMVEYYVQNTDTLAGIALRHNMAKGELSKLNNHTSRTYPGQILYVYPIQPKDAGATSSGSAAASPAPSPSAGTRISPDPKSGDVVQPPPVVSPHPHKPMHRKFTSPNVNAIAKEVSTDSTPELGFGKRQPSANALLPVQAASGDSDQTPDVYKEDVTLCTDTGNVRGVLTMTPSLFIFEPNLTEAAVKIHGVLIYQLSLDLPDVLNCKIIDLEEEKAKLSEAKQAEMHAANLSPASVGSTGSGASKQSRAKDADDDAASDPGTPVDALDGLHLAHVSPGQSPATQHTFASPSLVKRRSDQNLASKISPLSYLENVALPYVQSKFLSKDDSFVGLSPSGLTRKLGLTGHGMSAKNSSEDAGAGSVGGGTGVVPALSGGQPIVRSKSKDKEKGDKDKDKGSGSGGKKTASQPPVNAVEQLKAKLMGEVEGVTDGLWQVFFIGDSFKEQSLFFTVAKAKLDTLNETLLDWTEQYRTTLDPAVWSDSMDNKRKSMRVASIPMFIPQMITPSRLFTDDDIPHMLPHLPPRLRLCDWELRYSIVLHGCSLQTFYAKIKSQGPILLALEDEHHHVFGAFFSEEIAPGPHYVGDGECFVFKLRPEMKFYHWTSSNQFFVLAQEQSLAVGSGGSPALWLDHDLEYGASGKCETFGSESLASAKDFKCRLIEAWSFKGV